MRVQRLVVDGQQWHDGTAALAPTFRLLVEHATLASAQSATDPMEQALHELERASRRTAGTAPQDGRHLLREYPLSLGTPRRLAALGRRAQRHPARRQQGRGRRPSSSCVISTGRRCGAGPRARGIMARDGLRVLGVAQGHAGRRRCTRSRTRHRLRVPSGSWASPIHCGRTRRGPSPSATKPASASITGDHPKRPRRSHGRPTASRPVNA